MSSSKARVWDPVVRIGHWALALAVLVAVLTAGRPLDLHSRAGYLILAYVLGRVLWGVLRPGRARFWQSLAGPKEILAEIRATIARKEARPDGLGPLGALIVTAMLAALTMAALTGIGTLAVREGQGPFAPLLGAFYEPPADQRQIRQDIPPTDPDVGGTTIISRTDRVPSHILTGEHPDIRSGGTLKAVHGFFSTLTLWLALAHVLWVVAASALRGENLVLSMVTGLRYVRPIKPPSLAALVQASAPKASDAAAKPAANGGRSADGGRGGRADRKAEKADRKAERQAERQANRRGRRQAG